MTSSDEIGRIFRSEYGRCVATLIRFFGDIDLAEEAVQDAFTVAMSRWPELGLPPTRARGSRPRPATVPSISCDARQLAMTAMLKRCCCTAATPNPIRADR